MKYEPITEFSPERCEILASVIEQQPHTTEMAESGFCLNRLMHPCGTPSCIEGFARSLLDVADNLTDPEAHCSGYFEGKTGIEAFTGCQRDEALHLYWGKFSIMKSHQYRLWDITPAEAAAALRALAAKRQGAQQ